MTDDPNIKTETLPPAIPTPIPWEQAVRDAAHDRCGNCGGNDRCRVQMIVPAEAGGNKVVSNGILLCRPCELASGSFGHRQAQDGRRILNFWVSRKLFERIQRGIETREGFSSVSALVRFLMDQYVADESRYDDLEQYQDEGADIKVNVWINIDKYATFKTLVDKRGMTVTDSVKGLILVFLENSSFHRPA